jgi:hypothetical protein
MYKISIYGKSEPITWIYLPVSVSCMASPFLTPTKTNINKIWSRPKFSPLFLLLLVKVYVKNLAYYYIPFATDLFPLHFSYSSNMIGQSSIKLFAKCSFISIIAFPVIAYADPPRLDTPDNIRNFHIVVYFTISVIVLGSIGCFYVFYRAYKQWILNKKRLTMIYKLPFYTACTGEASRPFNTTINDYITYWLCPFVFFRFLNKCWFFRKYCKYCVYVLILLNYNYSH